MFLKTGEMKKIMKSSLKRYGLIVGNMDDHYLVYSDNWGVYVEIPYATNKFKAAIMELIGDLPEPQECYLYTIVDKEVQQERVLDYPDPYGLWKQAKDFTTVVPMFLYFWPHEYMVYQRKSDMDFVTAPRSLTFSAISPSELDTESEHMPERPSILNNTLYYKNESTIYWVHTESTGDRTRSVLFPHLAGMNFFEQDWIGKNEASMGPEDDEDAQGEADGAADEQLPY